MAAQTKFIIFGQSRSGSTLLKQLLNSHPDIHCDGELFNPDEHYVSKPWLLMFLKRFPQALISFRNLKTKSEVYGFTLFSYHLRNTEKCVNNLQKKGWLLIHIQRNDIFRQSLSYLIAKKTRLWHRKKNSAQPTYTLRIEFSDLVAELKKRIQWKKNENQIVGQYKNISVAYEKDLVNNDCWANGLAKVFAFLGVSPISQFNNEIIKTDERQQDEIIENYDSLIEMLKTSEYAHIIPIK